MQNTIDLRVINGSKRDDYQFQIVYGVIFPINFQSSHEFLVHYQNKDLQAH
jgi:hypothetical protein